MKEEIYERNFSTTITIHNNNLAAVGKRFVNVQSKDSKTNKRNK